LVVMVPEGILEYSLVVMVGIRKGHELKRP